MSVNSDITHTKQIIDLLARDSRRNPCTLAYIYKRLGIPSVTSFPILRRLINKGLVVREMRRKDNAIPAIYRSATLKERIAFKKTTKTHTKRTDSEGKK